MEQLTEQETSPIPPAIMGFALASTYAVIEFHLERGVDSYSSEGNVTVQVPAEDQGIKEILLESYLVGWPWIVAQERVDSFASRTWAPSSPLVGYINRVCDAAVVGQGEQSHYKAIAPGKKDRSSLRMAIIPPAQEGLWMFGLCRTGAVDEQAQRDLGRLAIMMAGDWSEAHTRGELTRGIHRYIGTALAFTYNKLARSESVTGGWKGKPSRKEWYSEAVNSLSALRGLTSDWNGYGAEAPNKEALEAASLTLEQLEAMDLQPSRILPSAAGGVSICFFRPKKYAELEYYNTGETVSIIKNTKTNWRDVWEVDSPVEAIRKIKTFLEGTTQK
jgi:hypothetical protein